MRKLLSVLLVAVLACSATATAYAEENKGGKSTINVEGEYVASGSIGEVVSVDIGWEDMSFEYTEGAKQWDYNTHSYIGGDNGSWSDNKPAVTMTNHSNVDVVAQVSFTPSANVTGTFYSKSGDTYTELTADEQGANLSAAAEGSELSSADAKSFYFGISGGAITKDTPLGTITVHISKNSPFTEADLAAFTYTTDSYGRVKITGVKDTTVTELAVPDFVYEIECGALANCTRLEKLTVPFAGNRSNGEQTYIGYAFGANNYTESGTVLPTTLKEITVTGGYANNETLDSFAFYDCTNLTNIVIGDGVTYINQSVFVDCISLESLTVPFVGDCKKEITDSYQFSLNFLFGTSTYGTKYADNVYKAWGNIIETTSERRGSIATSHLLTYIPKTLKEVTVNGGVIPWYAFDGLEYVEKVILGNGVKSIGWKAFIDCWNLKEVIIPDSVIDIGPDAFRTTPFQDTLLANAEDGCIYINKVLYQYNGSDTDIVIKDGTVAVSDFAFWQNTKIEKVTCPDSLRYIGCQVWTGEGYGAFYGCTNLKTVVLNEGLEYIGISAFQSCSAIEEIDFPDSLSYVGYLAFDNTSWANNLPNGEIYIGKVFYKYNPSSELTEPTTITIKEGTVGIADRAFSLYVANFVNLTGVNIPDSVTWIGDEAFYKASDLQEIKLPKNLTELGYNSFNSCTSLKEITIPKGVKKLPDYIFNSCKSLSVRFEENSQLNTICDESISGTNIYYLPEGIQYIFDDLGATVLVTSMNKLRAVKLSWKVQALVPAYADLSWTTRAESSTIYYYSDEKPPVNPDTGGCLGTYWHYDENGKPVKW